MALFVHQLDPGADRSVELGGAGWKGEVSDGKGNFVVRFSVTGAGQESERVGTDVLEVTVTKDARLDAVIAIARSMIVAAATVVDLINPFGSEVVEERPCLEL